jgi:hypothetical protein
MESTFTAFFVNTTLSCELVTSPRSVVGELSDGHLPAWPKYTGATPLSTSEHVTHHLEGRNPSLTSLLYIHPCEQMWDHVGQISMVTAQVKVFSKQRTRLDR